MRNLLLICIGFITVATGSLSDVEESIRQDEYLFIVGRDMMRQAYARIDLLHRMSTRTS